MIEPLSNPKHRQSMIVDKKKNGRTLAEIINGENLNAVLPDIPGLLASPIPMPLAVNNEEIEEQQRRQKEAEEFARKRAEEEARVRKEAAERSRREAEAEKQRQEQMKEMIRLQNELAARQREQEAAEARRKAEEDRRLQEEARKLALMKAEMDRRRREEAEATAYQEKLRRERLERELERSRLQATLTELSNSWLEDLLDSTVQEQAEISATQCYQRMQDLRRLTKVWVERARFRIEKRHLQAVRQNKLWHFHQRVTLTRATAHSPCGENDADKKARDAVQSELKSLRTCYEVDTSFFGCVLTQVLVPGGSTSICLENGEFCRDRVSTDQEKDG